MSIRVGVACSTAGTGRGVTSLASNSQGSTRVAPAGVLSAPPAGGVPNRARLRSGS